jgi:hypothetical protein
MGEDLIWFSEAFRFSGQFLDFRIIFGVCYPECLSSSVALLFPIILFTSTNLVKREDRLLLARGNGL